MPVERCYQTGVSKPYRIAGYAALALGAALLFACVPYWAFIALFGVVLVAVGLFLIRISNTGR